MAVIVGMAMALNGFIADANGDLTPLYPDLRFPRNIATPFLVSEEQCLTLFRRQAGEG